MPRFDHITTDPAVLDGQPCIRGTRITVRRLLAVLADDPSREALRQDYPQVTDEDVRQALAYAAANLEDRVLPLKPAS